MKKTLFLLIGGLILSCNQTTKTNQTENLDWLTGNWKRLNDKAGKETFENWIKISPTEFSGIGFTLQKGDTISQEKMDLVQLDGKWSFIVRMPDEINPTEFKVTELKTNQFVCVNDSNDFPNKIKYWKEGEMLKADVSNEEMNILFEFEKTK